MSSENNSNSKRIGLSIAGGTSLYGSKNMVLGKKRVYHGTSKANWEKIKKSGLLASKGGVGGESEFLNDFRFSDDNKGRVHVTRMKNTANNYARLNSVDSPMMAKLVSKKKEITDFISDNSKYVNRKDFHADNSRMFTDKSIQDKFNKIQREKIDLERLANKEALNPFKKPLKNGKVIKANIDYDKFKRMEYDKTYYRGNPKNLSGWRKKKRKQLASVGIEDIIPEEIVGSNAKIKDRVSHTVKKLPGYIKNNPLRFGGGLALASSGLYALNKSLKKENKMNKTAFDIVNNSFEKIASDISSKDILRRDKRKNEAPKTKLFDLNAPENFAKGWNVRTKFRPTMHSENELGYNVSSSGFGRRNQRLVAETNLRDLVEMSKNTDESKKEYLNRVEPHKKNLYKAEDSTPTKLLAGATIGALGGGLAGAIKAGPSGAVPMVALGALSGVGVGAGMAELGERGARKKLLNSLNSEERELLGKKKEYWANRQSQKATSAQKITGYNTYMY